MSFSEVFPLEVVRKNALQIYQVQLTNWGDASGAGGPNTLASPIFKFSLAGLSIDPESLITSVIVRPTRGGVLDPTGLSQPDDFVIDKERPFTGRLTFPRRPPYNGTWGLVAFRGDRYTATMTGQDGLAANFTVPQLVRPDLRVIMYIDGAPPPAMTPKRTPRRATYSINDGAANTTIAIEPINGRRLIRVTCAPIVGPGHTFKFRGITPGGGVPQLNTEFAALAPDLATGATGAAGAVRSQTLIDPTCAWLHVLATPNGGGAASQIDIDMWD